MSLPGTILTTPTTSTSASSTSSSVPASATPTLIFVGVNEMFTCGISPIQWGYLGPSVPMSLNVTNLNVPQQAPLSTSSSNIGSSTSDGATSTTTSLIQPGIKRQYSGYGGSYLPDINEQLVNQWDPTTNNWTWPAVNVPQGWYRLLATIQDVQTPSSTFFVQNGTNVECVLQFAPSSSSTPPVPVSTGASPSPAVGASSGHSHAGAIAGGVIGGIAFFAAALVAFLFWFLRRRSDRSRGAENGHGGRWSAMALKRSRHASGGGSSTRKDQPGLPALEADQTFIGSDEELSTVGHEKAISPISPTILPYHPSHPQSRRTSTQTTGSYGRALSNPEPPLRPPSYQPHVGEVLPLERAQTAGNGPRRKPAPRYDEAGETAVERNGACSSRTTLNSTHGNNGGQSFGNGDGNSDGTHVLQHQGSFGAMRPMHVIIPDPPPPAHT
ncbi:hypothetical protein EDB89DRAFT_215372 [Lactarius sanguifluus]|nr:hypothetical protein EDB89DRAFT_215372 [Lactarius sanguifluus]